nr:MAG TPA: ECF sigma factor [Caudoviricetes sp.]
MNENWYALIIASQYPVTVEQAFQILDKGKKIVGREKGYPKFTNKELQEMQMLKEGGKTYREIGEIFGLSAHATFCRLKKFKKKVTA